VGKKSDRGTFGKVFSPPLKCKDGPKKYGEGFVSKILEERFVQEEYENSMKVRELDPGGAWSITAEHACRLGESQDNTNFVKDKETYEIIYRNGGVSLYDLLLKPGVTGKPHLYVNGFIENGVEDPTVFDFLDPEGLSRLIKGAKGILAGLDELNKKYIHGDMHLGNVVYDGHRSRLIDFGSLKLIDDNFRIEKQAFDDCFQLNTKEKKCTYVASILTRLIVDISSCSDLNSLWYDLHNLLRSEWVTRTFPGRFDTWFERHRGCAGSAFRSDYAYAIMDCPV
jgi:serine/threonine protein kinase